MTAAHHNAEISTRRKPSADLGFTLLEVLVSLGILIGALAGIAALLPAFGSRLAEAVQTDRAATMIANARADRLNRGLIRYQLWETGTVLTGSTRAIVFGEGLTLGGTAVAMTSATNSIALAGTAALRARIDPTAGFHLRDAVQTTVTESSVITGTGYVPGVCYGCMISSSVALSGSTGPGAQVRMTTVAFRKPQPAAQGIVLTATNGLTVFQVTGTLASDGTQGPLDNATAALIRKQYLAGCSAVLAVPPPDAQAAEPRWMRVASSWTAGASGRAFITLTGADSSGLVSGSTLRVFGFEGLLRIDEQFVNFE